MVAQPTPNPPIDEARRPLGAATIKTTPASRAASKFGFCVGVAGRAGVGKTALAAMFADVPEASPVLHMDAEGGALTISHREDIAHHPVESWDECHDFTEKCYLHGPAYRTVFWDNLVELVAINMRKHTRGKPEREHYNLNQAEVLSFVRRWRAISLKYGTNVVFPMWTARKEDSDTGLKATSLTFNPAIKDTLPGVLDMIIEITVVDKPPYQRCISFSPSPTGVSKLRRPPVGPLTKIPLEIYYTLDDNPIADLLAVMKGGGEWPEGKYGKLGIVKSTEKT